MKAQRSFGLALSWPRVTAVFLVDVLILAVASHCPDSWQADHHVAWWVGVGVAAVVTLLSVVSYHGITVISGLATWVRDWRRIRARHWVRGALRQSTTSAVLGVTR